MFRYTVEGEHVRAIEKFFKTDDGNIITVLAGKSKP